jgi:hypothetical protein
MNVRISRKRPRSTFDTEHGREEHALLATAPALVRCDSLRAWHLGEDIGLAVVAFEVDAPVAATMQGEGATGAPSIEAFVTD